MPRLGLGTSLVIPRQRPSAAAGPPAGSIVFEDVAYSAVLGTSFTVPLAVANADGKQRLVAVAMIIIAALPSWNLAVTVDGEAATPLGLGASQSDGGGPNAFAHVRFFLAPGTANEAVDVVVTSTNGEQAYVAYAALWTVDHIGALLDHAQQNKTDGSPLDALAVDTADNGVAATAAFGYLGGGAAAMTWTGLGEVFDSVRAFDDSFSGASLAVAAAATPQAVSASWSGLTAPKAQVGAAVSFAAE